MFHIVLVEPQIPPNTGNVARLCAAMQCELHLVHPLGFTITDRKLKRAGLDYWPHVKMHQHNSLDDLWEANPNARFFYLSTHAKKPYTQTQFQDGDFLVFGPEDRGLSKLLLKEREDQTLTIPMKGEVRSLNLASSVAIVLMEAIRQIEVTPS